MAGFRWIAPPPKIKTSQAVLAHTFNPVTEEAEAGGTLNSRPALSTEFLDSQSYIETCLEKQTKN